MKQITISTVLLFIVLLANAQKDTETKVLLDKVSEKALNNKVMKADFEYKLDYPHNKGAESYNGKVTIKGTKYRMEIDETITYCDAKSRWVFLVQSNEVNVSTVVEDEEMEPEERFLSNPLSIFTLYQKGFKYKITGNETIESKEYTVVDLSPENLDKPYFKIRYWFNSDNDLFRVKYFQKDGTKMILTLSDLETNAKEKDSYFVFDESKFPNVEVIDLRE